MRRLSTIFFLGCLFTIPLFAQGEIDDEEKLFYRNERTWALMLNTQGWGVNYRYAKRIDGFRKTLYEIEFDYIKDKREKKISGGYQTNYRTFVYGKLNSFYTLKGGIGFQKELYQKQDKGSISIRYFYNIGPSIGFLKPIYYDIAEAIGDGSYQIVTEKFSDHININNIQGRAPFTRGLGETKVVPGLYAKFGLTFEYSKFDKAFLAIEAGIAIDAFAQRIPIMYASDPNQHKFLFPALYFSIRTGKVIDAQFKRDRNRLDNFIDEGLFD